MPYWSAIVKKHENRVGYFLGPMMYMFGHFIFFIVSHVMAMLEFEYYYFNRIMISVWLGTSLWNGANFYMEYFAKKYEQKMAKYDQS